MTRSNRSVSFVLIFIVLQLLGCASVMNAKEKVFIDIPEGDAVETLRELTVQADLQLMYPSDVLFGVLTPGIKGRYTGQEALGMILEGTNLTSLRDEESDAYLIRHINPKMRSHPTEEEQILTIPTQEKTELQMNKQSKLSVLLAGLMTFLSPPAVLGQDAGQEEKDKVPADEEITVLSPFEVTGEKGLGYPKLTTVTSSRAGVLIINDPVAIEVISGELLKDFSLTLKEESFKYSSSVVATQNEVFAGPLIVLRGFDAPLFLNGAPLSNVFGLLPSLITDNVDRVEIAKGAAGLFYGNTTAGGVINYVTKKPQFINATSLDLTGGTFSYYKAMLDYQAVIKPDLAVRLIASAFGTEPYVNDSYKEFFMAAPSVTYRPSELFEATLRMSYTNQKSSYPSNIAWLGTNPKYFEDYLNPSRDVLDYMKSTYDLADDTETRAKIVERWGETNLRRGYLRSWVEDTLGRTGVEEFWYTNNQFDWWRASPEGDKVNMMGHDSYVKGRTMTTEAVVRVTPVRNLTFNYMYQFMDNSQSLWLARSIPNGGLRPDGRIWTTDASLSISTSPNGGLPSQADTHQLDALYTFTWGNIDHQIQAGAELRKATSGVERTSIDFDRAAPRLDRDGNTLTGIDAYRFVDPFGSQPAPNVHDLQSSGPTSGLVSTLAKYNDYYVSYRGTAFDGKLNVLAGARQVNQSEPKPKGSDTTWTFGALYTVIPGFRVFASASKVVVFTNQLSVDNTGATPADNPVKLDNESGEGVEFGIKTNWRDNTLSGSVSYYKDKRANIVSFDTVRTAADPRNNDDDTTNIVSFWVNGGLYQVQGIDGDLTWTPNQNFQAMFNWNYMWEANILSDPAQDPANSNKNSYKRLFDYRRLRSPEWQANLVMKYNFTDGPLKGVSLGTGIAYKDEYFYTDSILIIAPVPAETTIDLFAIYQTMIGDTPSTFRLNLINLTDETNDITRGNGFEARISAGFKY